MAAGQKERPLPESRGLAGSTDHAPNRAAGASAGVSPPLFGSALCLDPILKKLEGISP
jgi:hypothetical protein